MRTLKFSKLSTLAMLPTRASINAAGMDLYSTEDTNLASGKRAAIRTGLSVAIPHGFYGRIAPRSGLALKNGIDVLAGVIDSDYRGEILCVLINLSEADFFIHVHDRIAQLIIEKIITPEPDWDADLDKTTRGQKGFGSSGE
jgi:dUTP pyrophosphatase